MTNPYVIIIALFIVAGIAISLYSWIRIKKDKATKAWPSVTARVLEIPESENPRDTVFQIPYEYQVGEKSYHSFIEIPAEELSLPHINERYKEKYPAGSEITVYYDPKDPVVSSLETGAPRDDWLILGLGIGAVVFGTVLLFVNVE